MGNWKDTAAKTTPLPPPDNIIHEVPYRGRRICCTDDKRLVGQAHPDKWGFTTDRGYVVLDEFDEHEFGIGMHWFYTPDDAACAIEMLDMILPTIKEGSPATTLLYEYGLMRQYRREFWQTYGTIVGIQAALDEAAQFDDDPTEAIKNKLSLLRANVARGRGIG